MSCVTHFLVVTHLLQKLRRGGDRHVGSEGDLPG
jgi:hypothetical protein